MTLKGKFPGFLLSNAPSALWKSPNPICTQVDKYFRTEIRESLCPLVVNRSYGYVHHVVIFSGTEYPYSRELYEGWSCSLRGLSMKCLFVEAVLIPSTCLSVHCMHIQRKGELKVPLTCYNIHLYARTGERLSVEIRDMRFLNFKFQILTAQPLHGTESLLPW